MATKLIKTKDEEEEELLRQENDRRTTEALSKVAEIREKSKERSEDDRRKRALESIHRMEWLKNKNDLSVLQGKTETVSARDLLPLKKKDLDDYFSGSSKAKAKSRGRRKDRVEVVKNLEDLGLPPCEPPSARYATPPPPPQNAWSMKPGSALFEKTTAATMVTFHLKNYDEEAMLKKALEESLSNPEEGHFCNPEGYGEVSPWAPSSSNKSTGLARSVLGQESSRNENPRRCGLETDLEVLDYGHVNDLGRSTRGQKNDILHSGHRQRNDIGRSAHAQRNDVGLADCRPRNDTDPKSEMSNQSNRRSPTMMQDYETRGEESKKNESSWKERNKIEEKDGGTSSGGKTDCEEEPIDYYKKGKELAEKRARERALKFAAREAEEKKKKYDKVVHETQENGSRKTEQISPPHITVRFSPDLTTDDNNEELDETAQTLPDTKATILQLSAEAERLTKILKVPEDAVELQLPQVLEEQRQFWTSKETQTERASVDAPQPDSTTVTPPRDVSTTSQSTPRLYTPEDFIIMDNAGTLEIPSMNELSLGYGAGLNEYSPYAAYSFAYGACPGIGVLPQYIGNPVVQTPNSFPVVTSSSSTFITTPAAPQMNSAPQNMYMEMPDGLQTSSVATQLNPTNTEVTSLSPQKRNLSPSQRMTNSPSAAQNFYTDPRTSTFATQFNPTNVEVTSASPQEGTLSPSYAINNPPSTAQNFYAANMSPLNVTLPVTVDGSSMSEMNVNYQVPGPSSGVLTSNLNSGQEAPAQNIYNVDPWMPLNILFKQFIVSQLSGGASVGGNFSMETLASLIPPLPNVPQTPLSEVTKPAPPSPVLEPNIRLPCSSHQAPVNPSQSALLTSSNVPSVPVGLSNAVFCVPPVQAGYPLVQPPQRLPGSFIRGPSGRGRGVV